MKSFCVKTCRSKLTEHYKRTATVPTSVWSKTSPVDIHQIYTRLSWVKEEQTPAGSSQSELGHYTDVFTANKNGDVPKRILVQGQTGIGKSTFVKKLAVDWADLDDETTESKKQTSQDKGTSSEEDEDTSSDEYEVTLSDEYDTLSDEYEDISSDNDHEKKKSALKMFELVLVINLKKASKCPSLKDVVDRCHILPEEETALVEDMLNYITKNQEKVLLVFDGYDEYGCGTNSEIYEIFRGTKLRNCCVLITTRNSKADDLREFKDVHAEITGFSKKDRKAFMRRMLGGRAEAKELRQHLSQKNLTDLTRVPLLLLFFCTLWKKGKLKSFPETKTKLYLAIVQYVLDYNQGKHSPARFRKVEDFKEILTEIGKVALECLLKDDHVFEYDELSAAILCEESRVIGLLQVTEYAENLRPAGMVSFIHKSIQEFLAAWYITYRCVPEGNLGEIEQHTRTLLDCEALENVFQFICGLSDDGAVKVFQHFTSVRISDPTLDLSKTIPDVETETDLPVCHHYDCDEIDAYEFINLVYNFFQEVHSKAELFINCFECTGRIIHVTRQVIALLRNVNVKELTQVIYTGLYSLHQLNNFNETHSTLYNLIEVLDWPDVLPSATESSEVLTLKDQRKFQSSSTDCCCLFSYILCFRTGQFQFYITDLKLHCDDHARLFTKRAADSVPSLLTNLCSRRSSLKFLTSLKCCNSLSGQIMRVLGAAIRNCKQLKRVEVHGSDDSVCDLLEQVLKPTKCSLTISNCQLTSAGAVKLASLLPTFIIITLDLDLRNCCSSVLDALFTSIRHQTLETLALRGINLTATAAAALGRSLADLSSLKSLMLEGVWREEISQDVDLHALFGGLNKRIPLSNLTFYGFSVRGSIAPLTNSFCFFPNLRELCLGRFIVDEHNLFCLLDSLRFVPNLMKLVVSGEPVSYSHCCATEVNTVNGFTHKALAVLVLSGLSLNPGAAAVLGGSLSRLLTLEELTLSGPYGSFLQAEEMKALFGSFSKTLPLIKLTFSGYNVRGCLFPLTESFRFLPNLRELNLGGLDGEFNMDEHNLCGVLDSLRLMPNLKTLSVKGKLLSQEQWCCCTADVNTVADITHMSLEKLYLHGITLTPRAATLLGRSLPKMSSLQEIALTGVDVSILQAEEMEELFGGLEETLPLCKITFRGFGVKGCLAPLTKSFSSFPYLREFCLRMSNVNEHACSLLESLRFVSHLGTLSVHTKHQGLESGINSLTLRGRELNLNGITFTPAVVAVLGRLLPEMTSLVDLELTGVDGSILSVEDMKALFGGFTETLSLYKLTFTGYSLKGCFATLTESFRFFPNLWELNLGGFNMDEHDLCGLLEGLNFMPNLEILSVWEEPGSQEHCCTTEVNTMAIITHKTLEEVKLNRISLTPAVAAALGQFLPELPSLKELELTGARGSILQAEEMEALFGGFNKVISLTKLTFGGFSVRGCLAPLIRSFRFFPDLRELYLGGFNEELNMDEHNVCGLLESLRFTPCLRTLSVKGNPMSRERCCTASVNTTAGITHKTLKQLNLDGISLTPEVAAVLGRSLPEMSSLQELELAGVDGSILQAEEMEELFGGINKKLPLNKLTFRGLRVRGCLAPLTKRFCFFSNLIDLRLEQLNVDEHDVCSLLENVRFVHNLTALNVRAEHLGQARCFTTQFYSVYSLTFKGHGKLNLDGVSLTPAEAAALGRSLPEMSSLQELEITGVDGSILQTKDVEALFGGFNKTLPLYKLTLSGFSLTDCLVPLTNSFCFFPNLRELCLGQLNMDERDLCCFLESLRFIPSLEILSVKINSRSHTGCYTAETNIVPSFTQKNLKELKIDGINLTPAVATVLGRSLPQMSSLQELELTGVDGSILQAEETKALFGGFNKTLPLYKLSFTGFSTRGCLAPLTESFRFFLNLIELYLGGFTGDFYIDEHNLCGLLESLQFMPHLKTLSVRGKPLSQEHCCTAEVNTLGNITHKALENLYLNGISLTPTVATVLGRSLPEMPSLQELELTGVDKYTLVAEDMEALFGGFNKTLPLTMLTFYGFSSGGCPTPLTESFRFFPNLRELHLGGLFGDFNMDEHHLCRMLESLRFLPNLKTLSVRGNPLSQEDCCTAELNTMACITHKTLEKLNLNRISLTPAVATVLGRSLPEMPSLRELELTGVDKYTLVAEEMEALFGGFNKALPLTMLTFYGFSAGGCPTPLTESFRFFPNLRELHLGGLFGDFNMDEHHLCRMLESLRFLPNLKTLSLRGNRLSQENCCTAEVNTMASITHKTLEKLNLKGISLTPAVATVLGRSLPKMPSLQELELTGVDRCTLAAEEMEALFGGFSKTLPLTNLTFSGFSARSCLAPLAKSLQFFPKLTYLNLEKLNMDEHDLRDLLACFQCFPRLSVLNLSHNPLGHAVRSIVPHVRNLQKLRHLWIDRAGPEEDLKYVRDTVQEALPELLNNSQCHVM